MIMTAFGIQKTECGFNRMDEGEQMLKTLKKLKEKREYLFAGLFFTTLVFGMLIVLGTINSGYHLIDDHEFYSYQGTIGEFGLWGAIKINIKGDLAIRYRPLYIILRTLGVAVFGTNTILWSICKAAEIIITLQIFYVFARKEINIFFSMLFAILIMWGCQSEIWWRLGPQESFGMLLFSACLLVTYQLKTKNIWYNKLLFIFFLALLSIQKESFWVSIPWFALLLFAYECKENDHDNFWRLVNQFVKKHYAECMAVSIIFVIGMYIILFVVGTDKVSYAGYSADLSWKFYLLQTIQNLLGECFPYLLAFVIVALISYIGYEKSFISKSFVFQVGSCLYLLLAELVIYAKSGMESRYLLPWAVGMIYIVFILGYRFWTENPRMKVTIGGLAVLLVFIFGREVVSEGIKFTAKGKDLQNCVDFVISNSSATDKVVAVSRDGEIDHAFGVLMKYQYQYMDFSDIGAYEGELMLLEDADVLFGKTGQVYYRLSEEAGLSIDNYDFYVTGNYEAAIKK